MRGRPIISVTPDELIRRVKAGERGGFCVAGARDAAPAQVCIPSAVRNAGSVPFHAQRSTR